MQAAKVQASLRICAVSPEPSLLAHTSSESRGTFRQKARSLAPLNGWACAVKICHDGMLEDTNSLDGAHTDFESSERVSHRFTVQIWILKAFEPAHQKMALITQANSEGSGEPHSLTRAFAGPSINVGN